MIFPARCAVRTSFSVEFSFEGAQTTDILCDMRIYFACSPEEFCEYFFAFAWEFCIERWRGFFVSFFWPPSPTKQSTKSPRKIRRNSGQNSGRKFEKFGKLSFCNFSDLMRIPSTPELPTKEFCLETGLGQKFFPKENLLREEIAPTAARRTFTPSARRVRFPL